MLLTRAALVGLGNPRGGLVFSRDRTKAPSLGTERDFEKLNCITKCAAFCCRGTSDKPLLGGSVLVIPSIEQTSQQLLARGRLVYCNDIGTEVSIE